MRARDASSICGRNPNDEIHRGVSHNGLNGITFGSSGASGLDFLAITTAEKLGSSRRNGTSSAMLSSHWWRGVSNGGSITSRGSSWFDSVPSAYGGVRKQKGGDIRGGNKEADSVAEVTVQGKIEERMSRRLSSATSAAASSFSPAAAAAAAAAHVVAETTCGHPTGVTLTNADGTRTDEHGNGSCGGEIRHGKGGLKGVSNEERPVKGSVRDRGVSETGSSVDARSSRVGGRSRR